MLTGKGSFVCVCVCRCQRAVCVSMEVSLLIQCFVRFMLEVKACLCSVGSEMLITIETWERDLTDYIIKYKQFVRIMPQGKFKCHP